jgi:hypothetical protein
MQFYGFFPAFALEEGLMILIFIKNYLSAVKILLFFKTSVDYKAISPALN